MHLTQTIENGIYTRPLGGPVRVLDRNIFTSWETQRHSKEMGGQSAPSAGSQRDVVTIMGGVLTLLTKYTINF